MFHYDTQLQEALYNAKRHQQEVISIYETLEETKLTNLNLLATNNTLEDERDRVRSEYERFANFIEELKEGSEGNSVAVLVKENETLRHRIEQLNATNEENKTELQKLSMQLEQKNDKLEETLIIVDETKQMLQQLETERRTYDQRMTNYEKKYQYSDAETQAYKSRVDFLLGELDSSHSHLTVLSDQVKHWQVQCQHLTKQVGTL